MHLAPFRFFASLVFNIILVLCFMLIINQLQVKLEGHKHQKVSQKERKITDYRVPINFGNLPSNFGN